MFVVAALPRSRTAWLARFLSYGNESMCLHDVSQERGWEERLDHLTHNHVGISDTSIASTWERIPQSAKVVTIRRDPMQVSKSLLRNDWPVPNRLIQCCDEGLNQIEKHRDTLSVAFEDIDARLGEIWEHCLGIPYDPVHTEEMRRVNIQIKDLGVYF